MITMIMMIAKWYRENKKECPNCHRSLEGGPDEMNLWPHYIGNCGKVAIGAIVERYELRWGRMVVDREGGWVRLEDVERVMGNRES